MLLLSLLVPAAGSAAGIAAFASFDPTVRHLALAVILAIATFALHRVVTRQLRRSEERFRALIEHTSDIIAIIGSDDTVRYVSPSATRILGYTMKAMLGAPVARIVDRTRPAGDFLARVRASDKALAENFRVRNADGDWVSLEVIAQQTEHDGILINCRDTTEREQMRQQLEQARRVSSLGRLATTVSHEFNNVLMGIQPFLYVLKRQAHGSRDILDIASRIELSVNRGKQITAQILRYTRPAEPSIRAIEVRDWFNELETELRGLLGNIEVCMRGADMAVAGDRDQLTQVVLNLALNARDAMHPNPGRLTIECREERTRRFHFGLVDHPERFVHLRVRDDGPGIAPEVLPQIFEPLFTTKRERGTGLGLAIVHQVVEKHGGMIFVDSTPGCGTTFHLFLPKASSQTKRKKTRESLAAPSLPKELRRVLIVEDEPAVAEGLALVLRAHDVETRIVDRVDGAGSAVDEFAPDALVLDVALPDGDGIDLYRALAHMRAPLPVVFSTAHASEARLTDLLQMPHVAFLQKPYSEATLIAELARCYPAMRAATSASARLSSS